MRSFLFVELEAFLSTILAGKPPLSSLLLAEGISLALLDDEGFPGTNSTGVISWVFAPGRKITAGVNSPSSIFRTSPDAALFTSFEVMAIWLILTEVDLEGLLMTETARLALTGVP